MPPPPQSPLNSAQIDSIYNWIMDGALNEVCGTTGSTTGGSGSTGGTTGGSTCDTSAVTFSGMVWPLVQTYCFGCHNGPNAQKGVHLENYQNVLSVANSGQLLGVIKGSGYTIMPPSGSLSSCQIASIEAWINNGSPNN